MNDFLKDYDDLIRSPSDMQSFAESPYLVTFDGSFNITKRLLRLMKMMVL